MEFKRIIIPLIVGILYFAGCSEDEELTPVEISTTDFTATIDEDPEEGQSLGKVVGSANQGEVTFAIKSQEPTNAFSIDSNTGEIKVSDVKAFDFETRTEVTGVVTVSSGTASKEAQVTITITDVPVVVTTENMNVEINENPEVGLSLGKVSATASEGSVTFKISKQDITDALTIDSSTGEIKIKDVSVFDFEKRSQIQATVEVTGGSDTKSAIVTVTIKDVTEFTAEDLTLSFSENPENGASIGSIVATVDNGALSYMITSQTPADAMSINTETGEITVNDKSSFDYEKNAALTATVRVSKGENFKELKVTIILTDQPSSWQVVGTAGFSGFAVDIDMEIDEDGTPYVVYQDLNNGGQITCQKFDGTDWVVVGNQGFSGTTAQSMKIEIHNGTPYVTYLSGSLRLPTVQKFNGSSWESLGEYYSGYSAQQVDLVFLNDVPHVVYSDDNDSYKNTVKKFDGTNWVTVGASGFSDGLAMDNSMAVDNGNLYVAYKDLNYDARATLMKYDGTSWTSVGDKGFTDAGAQFISLAFKDGTPYVAFEDHNGTPVKANLMKYDGTDWVAVGGGGFSLDRASYTSLAFHKDQPYVAFQDGETGNYATVMTYNGSSWSNVGDAGFSEYSVKYVKLEFYNGEPYVAYQDGVNGSKVTVMRYTE